MSESNTKWGERVRFIPSKSTSEHYRKSTSGGYDKKK